jgi:hypothetical protein
MIGRMRWYLLVLVASCGGDGDDGGVGGDAPTSANMTAKQLCVSETNKDRATVGKPPVQESTSLEAYADAGAMHDFSTSPHDHFMTTSGGGISFAENECPQQGNWNLSFGNGDVGMTVVACVAAFFAEGPGTGDAHGHYNNMIGPYATLGCGIYVQGQQITIVQDYGN